MKDLDHNNIVKLIKVKINFSYLLIFFGKGIASKKNFFLVMEYLEGGSLFEYMQEKLTNGEGISSNSAKLII